LGPAGYFRDPKHIEHYLAESEMLPYLNNEAGTDEDKAAIKARFSALHGAMLVMFTEDSVVYPKESEWFQQLSLEDEYPVQPLEESDFYVNDYIGLRALNEAGRVSFVSIVGDHLQFS
jgi:palmitoyl-protein thioesterase